MSIRTTEDRFKELGLKPPDLTFMKPPEKPGELYGRENQYNTRVLVDNWYEDRRQYKTLCSRCTGPTIYNTDYLAWCPQNSPPQIPPPIYQYMLDKDGEGWSLIRNSEDYCPYLQNYTTTYDLMHNWEVRRAGLKPRPFRIWKMSADAVWYPQNDNTLPFGNLTQLGYRKAPQIPLLPNDWDRYGGNHCETEYKASYPERRYPQDYVHCRKVPTREISQEISSMTLVKKPKDPCDLCGESYLYQGGRAKEPKCRCLCHHVEKAACKYPTSMTTNSSRFGTMMPAYMLAERPGKQLLHPPKMPWPYKAFKHKEHLPPVPCAEPCEPVWRRGGAQPVGDQVPDECRDYAGEVLHDYKGPQVPQENVGPLCECFKRNYQPQNCGTCQ